MTLFTVFVYYTHPSKDKIRPGDAAVHVWAWMDMVGDVCFVHQLNFHVSNAELIGDAQRQALGIPDQGSLNTLLGIGLAGVVMVSGGGRSMLRSRVAASNPDPPPPPSP